MKTASRLCFAVVLSGVSFQALALPPLPGKFANFYAEKDIDVTPLAEKACGLCHDGFFPNRGNLNAFGKDVQAEVEIRAALVDFSPIEELDSDEDGFTNIEEIIAGTLPGDAESVPADPAE